MKYEQLKDVPIGSIIIKGEGNKMKIGDRVKVTDRDKAEAVYAPTTYGKSGVITRAYTGKEKADWYIKFDYNSSAYYLPESALTLIAPATDVREIKPVYKLVAVNGKEEFVSSFVGKTGSTRIDKTGDCSIQTAPELTYTLGQVTTSANPMGIYCVENLTDALNKCKDYWNFHGGGHQRRAVLEVLPIGDRLHSGEPCNYQSVYVKSVLEYYGDAPTPVVIETIDTRPPAKFKVGDVVDYAPRGKQTITGVVWGSDAPDKSLWAGHDHYHYTFEGIDAIVDENPLTLYVPEPKFKVGDKVFGGMKVPYTIKSSKWSVVHSHYHYDFNEDASLLDEADLTLAKETWVDVTNQCTTRIANMGSVGEEGNYVSVDYKGNWLIEFTHNDVRVRPDSDLRVDWVGGTYSNLSPYFKVMHKEWK